jgi:hypothetical protein
MSRNVHSSPLVVWKRLRVAAGSASPAPAAISLVASGTARTMLPNSSEPRVPIQRAHKGFGKPARVSFLPISR